VFGNYFLVNWGRFIWNVSMRLLSLTVHATTLNAFREYRPLNMSKEDVQCLSSICSSELAHRKWKYMCDGSLRSQSWI
jgi:hypothetical protein